MSSFDCEHEHEWIGGPAGMVTQYWECVDCGSRMTSGEMTLWNKLGKRLIALEEALKLRKIEEQKE